MMQIKELGSEPAKGHARIQNALADLSERQRLRSVLKALERGYGGSGCGRKAG